MMPDVAARVAVGTAELGWSRWAAAHDPRADRAVVVGGTILGVRNLVQAVLVSRRPHRAVRRLSAAVDATHAASMVLAARLRPSLRRPCLVSALTAAALATTSWLESRERA